MSEISEAIRQFAEDPDCFIAEPLAPARRIEAPSFTLLLSPWGTLSNVTRVRSAELDATIADVRRQVRQGRFRRTTWNVGPSTRPEGLVQLLLARGFVPATEPPYEPEATAMALVRPPPAPPGGIEVRRVRDVDEFLLTWRMAIETFGASAEEGASWLAAGPALWAHQDYIDRFTHLAIADGRPVGFSYAYAGPSGMLLGGSGVLPNARGRGAYRALVAARWTEAVALGKPALVIHAGAMSRPILERCGFEPVCHIDVLEDPHPRGP